MSRDNDEIRIAIAGMGRMGNFHLESLRQLAAGEHEDYYKGAIQSQLKKIRICGVCDVDSSRLAEHSDIATFKSFEKLIAESDPDIVIIATPSQTHFALAKLALENGVHALVEKPLVTSANEIERLIDIANRNGCRLISGHVERYNPVSIKIVSLLKETSAAAKSYSFVRTQKHDERISDDIIIDKVVHDVDLALYFFGPIEKVEIKETKKVGGKIYEARLETVHTSGVKGDIFVSWLVEGDEKRRQVEILCEDHKLFGDFTNKSLCVDGKPLQCEVAGMIKPENNQIKDELVDFIMYCTAPDPSQNPVLPLLSLDEIVESVKLIERIKDDASK